MENQKSNVSNKPSLETLKDGDTLMVSIRKVYHTKGDASKGYKASIELAQFITNPDRPTSAISMLNEGDDRFAAKRPQHAFQPVSSTVAFRNGWITKEAFEALSPSAGIAIADQIEGTHYCVVNKLNPTFDGKRLKVQILESITPSGQSAKAKVNPKTNATVLHGGKPVYRIAQVAFEDNCTSYFLASDATIARTSGDTLEAATKESIATALNK